MDGFQLRFKKRDTKPGWLDDDPLDHAEDGFEMWAILVNTMIKKIMGTTKIPDGFHEEYFAFLGRHAETSETDARRVFILGKPFGLTSKQVNAAFAEHYLMKALDERSPFWLVAAAFCLGQSLEDSSELLFMFKANELKQSLSGAEGGKKAAKNRAPIRAQVQAKVKKIIQERYLWNDGTQTIKSITDTIWAEIKTGLDSDKDWQGITSAALRQAKVGKQSIYDAVQETGPS